MWWKQCRAVLDHPNPDYSCVMVGGCVYVVSLSDRKLIDTIGHSVSAYLRVGEKIVFNNHTDLIACARQGVIWQTKSLSCGGIRKLRANGNDLDGEAMDPEDKWVPFRVNISTGEAFSGGLESSQVRGFWDRFKTFWSRKR